MTTQATPQLTRDALELPYRPLPHPLLGLGGPVFGNDQDKALKLAEAMNTGSVDINFFTSNHAAPFDGRNGSGLGVECGQKVSPLTCRTGPSTIVRNPLSRNTLDGTSKTTVTRSSEDITENRDTTGTTANVWDVFLVARFL